MLTFRRIACMLLAAVFVAGCAVSPEAESERQAREADIAAILAEARETPELGEPIRCLHDRQYDNFRALDEQRILFEHRRGDYWINTLRGRCLDLRYADVLTVRSLSSYRICNLDQFYANEFFDWPWYRRWPWRWGTWSGEVRCTFGEFQPVSAEQVAEIEAVLKRR